MNRPYAVGPIALLLLLAAGAALAAEKYFAKSGVTLRVVDPSEPGLVFTNRTRSETNTIRYSVALWKMGPDGNPLRMTNEVLARLGPGETSTVVTLFDTTEIRSRLREGDKVVGAIGLDCADCARGHSYRVYISYGEGGWFAKFRAHRATCFTLPPCCATLTLGYKRVPRSDEHEKGARTKASAACPRRRQNARGHRKKGRRNGTRALG